MPSIPHKFCPECGQDKPTTDFNRDKHCADGLQWRCSECNRARNRRYYEANKEKVIARTSAYQQEHREVARKAQAKYKAANREKVLAKMLIQVRAWREKNRDKDRAAAKRWRIQHRDAYNTIKNRYKARKRNAEGSYTAAQWQQLKHQYDYRCLCCGKREPEIQLTVDHVIPLIAGGSNAITNLQPLCLSCNTSKSDRHTTDYRLLWPRRLTQLPLGLD